MKRFFLSAALILGVVACGGAAPIVGYVQINPPNAPQPGAFNTSSGTVGDFTDTGLAIGGCVQASVGGHMTTTGINCGTGGGGVGGGGTINVGAQYSPSYYALTPSSTVLSALSPGTSGQILTTQGSSGPPFWGAIPLSASSATATYLQISSAAATYLPNTSIVSSPQFQLPYFSNSGTQQTLMGDSNITTDGSGNLTVNSIIPTAISQGGTIAGVNNTFLNSGGTGVVGNDFTFTSSNAGIGYGQAVQIIANPTSNTTSMVGETIDAYGGYNGDGSPYHGPRGLISTAHSVQGGGSTGFAIEGIATANNSLATQYGGYFSASGSGANRNIGLAVGAGSTLIQAPEGMAVTYGLTASSMTSSTLAVSTVTISNPALYNQVAAFNGFGVLVSTTITGGGAGSFTGLNASGQPNLASSATFVAGTNVTLSQSGSSITITASGGSGPSGSTSSHLPLSSRLDSSQRQDHRTS